MRFRYLSVWAPALTGKLYRLPANDSDLYNSSDTEDNGSIVAPGPVLHGATHKLAGQAR